MSWELVLDIFLDALKDSALVFAFVFLIHLLLSFVENKLSNYLIRHQKLAPMFGSLFGIIPQCGTSVMGADLYIKKYISIGTLVAIFLSCSDEAFIAILTSGIPSKMIMVLPLIGVKFVLGFVVGLLIDLIHREELVKEEVIEEETCHTHHTHNSGVHKHLIHPLIHALEIFAYVFVINMVLGLIIGAVGEDNFASFIRMNKYLTPLFSSIIGLIPNCASSLLLSELFIEGNLSFGALLAGLLVNSGLGMMVLLRNRKSAKNIWIIILICFLVAIVSGYITCLIFGF
ncbi:MAG: arsenic efflux protein [Bacilli bacterium]|nr:arsenic efflux protein [Bacilli bacterium]